MGKPKRVFHNPFKIINSQPFWRKKKLWVFFPNLVPASTETPVRWFLVCQVICLQEVDETWAGRLHQHFQSTLVNVEKTVLDSTLGSRWLREIGGFAVFFWIWVKLLKGEVTWWFEKMVKTQSRW